VGQVWEVISVTIKGVDLFSKENALNRSACSVVVAGIVSSNAKSWQRLNNFQTERTCCTYLSSMICYDSSALTETNEVTAKVDTGVRPRYHTKGNDFRDK